MHLQAEIPLKKPLKPKISPRQNYVTVYVGLTPILRKKLSKMANKAGKTESAVLRDIIDSYLGRKGRKKLSYTPYHKISLLGTKVVPRTVGKAQDRRLRELAEKTGRGISELVREAVEIF